jgi:hypothetical protein
VIDSRFAWAWPDLEAAIEQAKEKAGDQPPPPEITDTDLLKSMYNGMRALERQVTALANSIPTASSPPSLSRRDAARLAQSSPSPWQDGERMQDIQDTIEGAASQYKPVRFVSPMESDDGEKFVGVM